MNNYIDQIRVKGQDFSLRDSGAVRKVNNLVPDENGNINVETAGGGVDPEELTAAVEAALAEAKASGEFDGKTAYEYAQDGGYSGTEAQFADKLAEATPTKLPNPNALTINGTEYDGSKAVTVNIEGGGGSGGGDTVYARITYDAETDENTSTMTAAEMMAAYESGCTVVVVVATSGDVIDVREGSAVLAPYGNNTLLADIITETDKYRVLVECTDPSDPENGRIVVQPFRMGAQPLIGTTAEITPSQVAEAVAESRPVRISHTDEYGVEYLFTSFNIKGDLVIGEMLTTGAYDNSGIRYATFPYLKGILGDNEKWVFDETLRMATVEGLPTALPNPNKLTINGKSYDGSEEVTVNIEGGSNADWIATSEQIGGAPVFNAVDLPFTWSSYYLSMNNKSFRVNVGVEYDVYWEGTKYVCTPFEASGELFFGNADLQAFESVKEHPLSNKNAPFLFGGSGDTITMVTKNSTTAENIDISVTTHAYTVYNKLPKEYLPDDIGGNIDVTAEVGQTIVVEEVDGSGKPTKWRAADYQPRTHWQGEKVMLPEHTFIGGVDGNNFIMHGDGKLLGLTVGKTYIVVFDGVTYECIAEAGVASLDGITMYNVVSIGNLGMFGGTDNGRPFVLADILDYEPPSWVCLPHEYSEEHTLSITGVDETNTIPEKYLREGYPYYIDVTCETFTDASKPNVYTCADTVENVKAIYNSGREIKVRVTTTGKNPMPFLYFLTLFLYGPSLIDGDKAIFGFTTNNLWAGENFNLYLGEKEDGTFEISDTIGD